MNSLNVSEYFKAVSPVSMSETVDRIVKELSESKLGLDKILESLEVYLTSKETQKRSKAVKLLTEMITKLPENYLINPEIELFATYLCSKLEDHYSVSISSLPALEHLLHKQEISETKESFITKDKSILIIKSILKDIHVQSMVQNDRMIVFNMCQFVLNFDPLVTQIIEEKYATDFVYGFIQAMDGEKDPRNLLICFDCIRMICQKLNLGPFVEETFEVFACYFPIDFTPPKNESFIITKDMLIKSLRNCFSAKKEFAKFSMQLLLEKMHSNVEDSHLDAIQTFAQCSRESYDPNDYSDYIESLWSFCQKTVLNTNKNDLEEAALDAIEAMVFSISRSVQAANFRSGEFKPTSVSIDSFTEKAMTNPVKYLNEPDLKLVWPSVKCLHALAKGSSTSNLIVTKKCIPIIIEYFNTTTLQNQRKTYLDILWQFVENSQKFDKKPSVVLKENIVTLLKICVDNGLNKHLSLSCLTGIKILLGFDGLISLANAFDANNNTSESNYYFIAKFFWNSLWLVNEAEESCELSQEKNKIVEIFYLMGKSDQSVIDWLLSAVAETFQDTRQLNSCIVAIEIVKFLSDLIAKDQTLTEFVLAERILKIFINFLEALNVSEMPLEFLLNVLNGLVAIVENFSKNKKVYETISVLDSIVVPSLRIVVANYDKLDLPAQNNRSVHEIILRFSSLFRIYASNMRYSEKSKDILRSLSVFGDNSNETFRPLELESSVGQKMTTTILSQVFSNLDKIAFKEEVRSVFSQLKDKLVTLATEISGNQSKEDQEPITQLSCQFYASLLNKLESDSTIDAELDGMKANLIKSIETSNGADFDKCHRCLNLWIWITKALVMREHKASEFFTSKLIDWLDNSVLSQKCSEAFGTLLNSEATEYSFMTSRVASQIRLLYRQRFFNKNIRRLKENFDSEDETKKNQKKFNMMAIVNMVNYVPKAIVQQHIKLLMPVLLYSLNNIDTKNEQLLLNSLKSFELLINESVQENTGEYFLQFVDQVLERLLNMCLYKESMNIRLLALKCVNNLALNVAPNKLIKSQKAVCKGLLLCLNDKKRLCRQLAVEARNRWYLITTKTNESG